MLINPRTEWHSVNTATGRPFLRGFVVGLLDRKSYFVFNFLFRTQLSMYLVLGEWMLLRQGSVRCYAVQILLDNFVTSKYVIKIHFHSDF